MPPLAISKNWLFPKLLVVAENPTLLVEPKNENEAGYGNFEWRKRGSSGKVEDLPE